jgi:putative ABC transport system substrate-binding protein
MKRRRVLASAIAIALAAPLRALAQPRGAPVVGILGIAFPEDPGVALNLAAFRQGLKDGGYIEGMNLAVEYRWANNKPERLPVLAAELVARKVDVIVTEGGSLTTLAAKRATSTIPIVFHSGDAISDGIVNNLARPEGNLTGVSTYIPAAMTKAFQLLSEIVPAARQIAMLAIPRNPTADRTAREVAEAGRPRGIDVPVLTAATDDEVDAAFASLAHRRIPALVSANVSRVQTIVASAARHAVPAAYGQRAFVDAGGLLSYGASFPAVYVLKARYAVRVLRGAKVGELPVEQSDKFELIVNAKTARTLGIALPGTLLATADEVVE